jgi:sugar phosphate permease
LYSLLGIVVLAIYMSLSKKVESTTNESLAAKKQMTLSPASKKIVGKLSGLFAVDAFAGGFVIQSIVSFWFYTKFGADLAALSLIFSAAGALTALSFLAAAKIADRIGLINTMVFTHIPSNVFLILVGFAPSLPLAIAFYLTRMALSQMDVPTRQSYIVSVVAEEERTPAAGITNISRNISQAVSPSLTGYILQALPALAAPFVFGGALKIAYDIALYLNFRNIKPSEGKKSG